MYCNRRKLNEELAMLATAYESDSDCEEILMLKAMEIEGLSERTKFDRQAFNIDSFSDDWLVENTRYFLAVL